MDDRLRRLEGTVEALSAQVTELAGRLRALESAGPSVRSRAPAPEVDTLVSSEAPLPFSIAGLLGLVGRTFLVLGGAFLLRSITDAGWVPRGPGILLGLAYAVAWTVLAGRAGRRDATSAGFHALASVVIAYPIVCEAATSFAAVSPPVAAALLAVLVAAGFAIAVPGRLRAVAWLHCLGAIAAVVFLLFQTHAVATFIGLLLVLGAGTLWLGRVRGWTGPRWLVAAVLDLAVAWSVALVTDRSGLPPPYAHVTASSIRLLALSLPLLYLGSFAVLTLSRTREVGAFEIAQSAAVLLVGYGGAAHIMSFGGGDDAGLGIAAFVAGTAAYAVAFAFVRRQQGRGRNFFFYSSLALVLVLVGAATAASPRAASIVTGSFALVTAVLGGRFDRVTVRAHAAVFALASAAQSGLLRFVGDAFTTRPGPAWVGASATQGAVLALLALSYVALVTTRRRRQAPRLVRIPRFTIGLLTVAGLAATGLVAGLALLVPDRAALTPASVATARTAALAGAAVLLAVARRRSGLRETGWPVYPLLVFGGAKLLFEDIPQGGPRTLFLAFAFYGAALVLAPRLLRATPVRPAAAPVTD